MNEDVMITKTGRAKAIFNELKDQWEVTIIAENRSDLRKVHDEIRIWCKTNDMGLGILQQKTVKHNRIENVRVRNPQYQSEELMKQIRNLDTGKPLTDEESAQKSKWIEDYLREYTYQTKSIPEWSAKCIVRRGSQ
tara:strand:+ start:3742 stop:4149 length:408 start_codon:yes stop_codon:yes gene_type:complete